MVNRLLPWTLDFDSANRSSRVNAAQLFLEIFGCVGNIASQTFRFIAGRTTCFFPFIGKFTAEVIEFRDARFPSAAEVFVDPVFGFCIPLGGNFASFFVTIGEFFKQLMIGFDSFFVEFIAEQGEGACVEVGDGEGNIEFFAEGFDGDLDGVRPFTRIGFDQHGATEGAIRFDTGNFDIGDAAQCDEAEAFAEFSLKLVGEVDAEEVESFSAGEYSAAVIEIEFAMHFGDIHSEDFHSGIDDEVFAL